MRMDGPFRQTLMVVLTMIVILSSVPLVTVVGQGTGPNKGQSGMARDPGTGRFSDRMMDREGNDTNETDPMLEIGRRVHISTNWGDITIGLYENGAPITTSNFLNLTNEGFYNGIKFHRIIDGFVIQTGDPNTKDNNPYNDGMGGSEETIPLEVSENLTHVDGAVGMARSSEPDSASSQFYICDGAQHGLDGDYAVFGIVVDGIHTVRRISSAETYGNKRPLLKDHPVDDIVMNSVIVLPNEEGEGEEEETQGIYPAMEGVGMGLGAIFLLGIGLMVLIVVVFVTRRVIRWRKGRLDEDDILEAEVLMDPKSERKGAGRSVSGEEDWYDI